MEASGSVKKKRYYLLQKYLLKELLVIYNDTRYKFKPKLKAIEKQIGKRKGNRYEIEQVEKIFELIRLPADVEIIR